jgi:hypothetical protein
MKNYLETIVLSAVMMAVLASCSDDEVTNESNVTYQVEKIETQYREGTIKIEGVTKGRKNETRMPSRQVEELYHDIIAESKAYVQNKKFYSQTGRIDFGGYDVGVFPWDGYCPSGYEEIHINMDCEDTNPMTSIGHSTYQYPYWQTGITVTREHKNVNFVICRVDGRKFKPFGEFNGANHSFAVLRLGNLIPGDPAYTHTLDRSFDNEDNNNKNSYSGDIGPNIVTSNTLLRFVVMESTDALLNRDGASYKGLPIDAMGDRPYAVLSMGYYSTTNWYSDAGVLLYTDDEDNSNANWCKLDGVTYKNTYPWFVAGTNTKIRFVFI